MLTVTYKESQFSRDFKEDIMLKTEFVVGAYASLPKSREEQQQYYDLLGSQNWVAGTEIPYPGDLADSQTREWLANAIPSNWHKNTITAIPGTMRHINFDPDPEFGLASPSEEGRLRAIDFFKNIRNAIADFANLRNSCDISHIEIHTAPTRIASADAMKKSLEELAQLDWLEAKLIIEHCDRYIEGQNPEKGFLPLEYEIQIAKDAGIGITINWGRSVVEERNAKAAINHVREARKAGVLKGVMFSGAGPEATQYGYEWIDGHLPMAPDEPTSLMTLAEIQETAREALKDDYLIDYLGAKVCVPQDSSVPERLNYLKHIYEAVNATQIA